MEVRYEAWNMDSYGGGGVRGCRSDCRFHLAEYADAPVHDYNNSFGYNGENVGLKISGSEMSEKVYRFRPDRQAVLE